MLRILADPKLLGLAALIGVVSFSRVPEEETGPPSEQGVMLPRAEVLRVAGAPYLSLVVDYYWLQIINMSGRKPSVQNGRDIAAYANLATDLDPRFSSIYTYAGINIPTDTGESFYRNTDLSTRLLQKGVRAIPDNFDIRFLLAYNLIFFEQRFREAADILRPVIHHPEAPPYIPALVTRLYSQEGAFEAGLAMAISLRDSAEDEKTRAFFDRRVQEIEQERRLREVDAAVARFQTREGRLPASVNELIIKGDLSKTPEDPLGGQVFIDSKGEARATSSPKRFEMHFDQPSRGGP